MECSYKKNELEKLNDQISACTLKSKINKVRSAFIYMKCNIFLNNNNWNKYFGG